MMLGNGQQGYNKSQQGQSCKPDVVECYPACFRSAFHPSVETEADFCFSFQLWHFLVTSDHSLWKLFKNSGAPSRGPTELSLGSFCSPSFCCLPEHSVPSFQLASVYSLSLISTVWPHSQLPAQLP